MLVLKFKRRGYKKEVELEDEQRGKFNEII